MFTEDNVQSLSDAREASECAQLMIASDPWVTLRIPFEVAFAALTDQGKEAYVVRDAEGVAGVIVLDLRGLVAGYIQILCVRPDCRGHGLGSMLIGWAENRIAPHSPNVFICVSSFNSGARRLYERLGFEPVGALSDFIVTGHDEILLRKTRGTWADFRKSA
jgi:ribosomal-protein-alanine N-acetyltransferase